MALTRDELATLLIFQRITDSWVREVHRFESMRKRKQNFVIFRDSNNRKLTTLAELKVSQSRLSGVINQMCMFSFSLFRPRVWRLTSLASRLPSATRL